MKYEVFCSKVREIAVSVGEGGNVRFTNDTEKGRYLADFADGTQIIGSPCCLRISVKFGAGHHAMAAI